MGMFAITDPDLLAGQKEGYQVLEANTGTNVRDIGRLMDRYGNSNSEYVAKMAQAQQGAQALNKLRLDARLQDSQMRARIHDHKLHMLRKQYKAQEKAQRGAMYASMIGAASSMAPGVWGMMQPGPQVGQGPMSYTPQSDMYAPSPYMSDVPSSMWS